MSRQSERLAAATALTHDRPRTRQAGRLLNLAGRVGFVLAAISLGAVQVGYPESGVVFVLFFLSFPLGIALLCLLGMVIAGRGLADDPWRNRTGGVVAGAFSVLMTAFFGVFATASFVGTDEDELFQIGSSVAVGVSGLGLFAGALLMFVATGNLVAATMTEQGPRPPEEPHAADAEEDVEQDEASRLGGSPGGTSPPSRSTWPRGAKGAAVVLTVLAAVQSCVVLSPSFESESESLDVCKGLDAIGSRPLSEDVKIAVPRVGEVRLPGLLASDPGGSRILIEGVDLDAARERDPLADLRQFTRGTDVLVVVEEISLDGVVERYRAAAAGLADGDIEAEVRSRSDADVFGGGYDTLAGEVVSTSYTCGGDTFLVHRLPVPVFTTEVCAEERLQERCRVLYRLAIDGALPYGRDATARIGVAGDRLQAAVASEGLGSSLSREVDVLNRHLGSLGWGRVAESCPQDVQEPFGCPLFPEEIRTTYVRPGFVAVLRLVETQGPRFMVTLVVREA